MEGAAGRFHQLATARGRVPAPILAVGRRLRLTRESLGPDRDPLQGSPEQVAADVRRYEELGVAHFIFGIYRRTAEEITREMELFATQVRPLIS